MFVTTVIKVFFIIIIINNKNYNYNIESIKVQHKRFRCKKMNYPINYPQ